MKLFSILLVLFSLSLEIAHAEEKDELMVLPGNHIRASDMEMWLTLAENPKSLAVFLKMKPGAIPENFYEDLVKMGSLGFIRGNKEKGTSLMYYPPSADSIPTESWKLLIDQGKIKIPSKGKEAAHFITLLLNTPITTRDSFDISGKKKKEAIDYVSTLVQSGKITNEMDKDGKTFFDSFDSKGDWFSTEETILQMLLKAGLVPTKKNFLSAVNKDSYDFNWNNQYSPNANSREILMPEGFKKNAELFRAHLKETLTSEDFKKYIEGIDSVDHVPANMSKKLDYLVQNGLTPEGAKNIFPANATMYKALKSQFNIPLEGTDELGNSRFYRAVLDGLKRFPFYHKNRFPLPVELERYPVDLPYLNNSNASKEWPSSILPFDSNPIFYFAKLEEKMDLGKPEKDGGTALNKILEGIKANGIESQYLAVVPHVRGAKCDIKPLHLFNEMRILSVLKDSPNKASLFSGSSPERVQALKHSRELLTEILKMVDAPKWGEENQKYAPYEFECSDKAITGRAHKFDGKSYIDLEPVKTQMRELVTWYLKQIEPTFHGESLRELGFDPSGMSPEQIKILSQQLMPRHGSGNSENHK